MAYNPSASAEKVKEIAVTTATYSLNETGDHSMIILFVNYSSTGACTITLDTDMLTNSDAVIRIKDSWWSAWTNNITVATEWSETIDWSATFVISDNLASYDFSNNWTNWSVS